MRRILWLALWLHGGMWLSLTAALASTSAVVPPHLSLKATPPPLFAFGQALFDAGEYYRAIGELQRFLFFQPQHPLASEAQLTIGLAYFCGERWVQAFEVFRRVTRGAPDPAVMAEAALWMAESRAHGGDQEEAMRLFHELMRRYPGGAIAQRAAYLIGWSYMRRRQWIEAHEAFAQIDAKSPFHASAERLVAALDSPPELPHRSPAVARVLSTLLPGTGQIYTGHTRDGLIGLGLHGVMIAGTAGAAMAGLQGAAGVGAFFTWGFYQSQMANAGNSARDFNAQAEERFIGQLAAHERPALQAYPRSLPCSQG